MPDTITCPRCDRPNIVVTDGMVGKHREIESDGGEGVWCRRGGFALYREEGWIVIVGNGFPARGGDDPDMWDVAYFKDESGAQRWIDEHPKAKNACPIRLRNFTLSEL